ncbi:MAG: HlyD family type I secretion periplasmic adaptor subunit [Hyphomicrobium sp.]
MSQSLPVASSGFQAPAKPVKLDHKLTSVRRYMTAGFVTCFLLIGGIGGWAATTDLAGAVLAPGTVVVAGSVKKIQHPSGGVVGQIFVKNGDKVKAGDMLVRLDETVTRASLQLVTKQIDELLGRQARLRAERDDARSIAFADELLQRASEPSVAQIVSGERTLFETRVRTREGQKSQLGERILAMEEEIAGLTSQAAAKSREIELIGKELEGLETLEAKQLVTTTKMMALRREGARLDGEKAQLQAAASSSKGKIAEIELQRLNIDDESKSEVMKELRETEGKIAELSERRTAAEDQLRRIDLKSPVDGVVHQLSVHTVGGVINTAEPLMLIVPQDDKLVIEAKIAPHDIDQARTHEEATIRFPAFNQRTTPSLTGKVVNVAADVTEDQQNRISYFVARIEISDEEMKKLIGLRLVPGMPADVQIVTNARTALSYLIKPLEDQFAKAFKER